MPITNVCCFKINLRKGTKIIGWLSFAFSVVFIILTSIVIALGTNDYHKAQINENGSAVSVDVHVFITLAESRVILPISSIFCLSAILLIIGAIKNYMWLLLPWIFVTPVIVLSSVVYAIYLAAEETNHWLFLGSIYAIETVSLIYFLLVVLSYFQTLNEERNQKGLSAISAPWARSTTQLVTDQE